jgi:hypothetical protein
MKRVYTDERFPTLEILNHGKTIFEVHENGKLRHIFRSWENPNGCISEKFAGQRAKDYFDRLIAVQEGIESQGLNKLTISDSIPASKTAKPYLTEEEEKSLTDLIAEEKTEIRPAQKRKLRAKIIEAIQREKPEAQVLIDTLLEHNESDKPL